MRTTTSKLNRSQQVKVVVRLKPDDPESRFSRCVYLSQNDNELAVETGNKRQLFLFDHVAHPSASQLDIYKMVASQSVTQMVQGYNCCIFAYGQTGAGKTFSVLGDVLKLQSDLYDDSRGILPRLLQDVFSWDHNGVEKYSVICSYLQIYNEQIYDLLATDKRIHQIRQDFRKGVFIEGLIEKKVFSYREAIDLMLDGQKNRRIASTFMNNQSSRSHTIFTIEIDYEICEGQIIKSRKSKINIVDLAGSERTKHTNAEGERLRQGCNINRSLHVLGNVINSLVESAKKKKHIPFRDSKLTHYLKDSLGGNSITKLLANIHCSKYFYGDTLSTLMFAKRAKILKMKVEVNQSTSQNFDALRKQVRRLREELAQAKYFKNDTRMSERPSFDQQSSISFEKITQQIQNDNPQPPKHEFIKIFQQNQLHYKALLQIYHEHFKVCQHKSEGQKDNNRFSEWKKLQKQNKNLINLVLRFPVFTKIYQQNLILRKICQKEQQSSNKIENIKCWKSQNQIKHVEFDMNQIISHYEHLLGEIQNKFIDFVENAEKSFTEMQNESRLKDMKIKQLIKRKQNVTNVEQLKNENEFLSLNILKLQNQINKLQQNEHRLRVQVKQLKRHHHEHKVTHNELEDDEQLEQYGIVVQMLKQIKKQAQKQEDAVDLQISQMLTLINDLRNQVTLLFDQNQQLQIKIKGKNKSNKSHLPDDLQTSTQSQTKKSFFQNQFSREDLNDSRKYLAVDEQQIRNLHQNYSKQIVVLKMQIKTKQKQILDLKNELSCYVLCDRRIEQQFGKSLDEIIDEYRNIIQQRLILIQSKSLKNINKWKQQDPVLIKNKKIDGVDGVKQSDGIKRITKNNTIMHRNHEQIRQKPLFFSPK